MSGVRSETSDDYGAVIASWGGWRVALCRYGLQWLIQRHAGKGGKWPWVSRHYCTTRKALMRLCAASDAPPDVIETLRTLPENAARFDLGAWREAKADLAIT